MKEVLLIIPNYSLEKVIRHYIRVGKYDVTLPEMCEFMTFVRKAYDGFDNIKAVILNSDGGKFGALVKIANHFGVPSIVIQNGIWPELEDYNKTHYRKVGSSSHVFCMSNFMRDCYLKMGVDKSKLRVTGNCHFDNYKNIKKKKPDGKVVVLVGFSLPIMPGNVPWFHSPPIIFNNYFKVFDVAKKLSEYEFVIKLKPHGALQPEHFTNIPSNITVVNTPWIEWMDKVDVAIGCSTTAMSESIFVGVPTIVPKLELPFCDYMGAASEIEWDVDIITNTIRNSVGVEVDNSKFNEYYFSHNLNYNALNNVINNIDEVLNR